MKKYFPIIAMAIVIILIVAYLKSKTPKKQTAEGPGDVQKGELSKTTLEKVVENINPFKSFATSLEILEPAKKSGIASKPLTAPIKASVIASNGATVTAMRPLVKPLKAVVSPAVIISSIPKTGNPKCAKTLYKATHKKQCSI